MSRQIKKIIVVPIIVVVAVLVATLSSAAISLNNANYFGQYSATSTSYFIVENDNVTLNCVKYYDTGARRYVSASSPIGAYIGPDKFEASYNRYTESDGQGNNPLVQSGSLIIISPDVEIVTQTILFVTYPVQIKIYYHDLYYMKDWGNTL